MGLQMVMAFLLALLLSQDRTGYQLVRDSDHRENEPNWLFKQTLLVKIY
jgi:hypothetical protein